MAQAARDRTIAKVIRIAKNFFMGINLPSICSSENRVRPHWAKPIITIPSVDFKEICKMFSFWGKRRNFLPYLSAILTAVSRAISIIRLREFCRSAGGSASLVTRLSVTVHTVKARFPASAAVA